MAFNNALPVDLWMKMIASERQQQEKKMKIELEVNSDEADELVRLALISAYENSLDYDGEEVHKAFKIVIKQFSDPEQWYEWDGSCPVCGGEYAHKMDCDYKEEYPLKFWKHPDCTCPKMDDNDAFPTGYYVMSSECPIHGYEANSKDLTPEDIASVKGILSGEDADNREWIMSDEEAEEFYHRKLAGE